MGQRQHLTTRPRDKRLQILPMYYTAIVGGLQRPLDGIRGNNS
jgi:hypothetical protein